MKNLSLGAVVLGALVSVSAFQNCSGGDLPAEAGGVTPLQSVQPLKLLVPLTAMGPSSTMILDASGGVPPYRFSVLGGPATIDNGGYTVASANSGGVVSLRVTDSAGSLADGSVQVDMTLAKVTAGMLILPDSGTGPLDFPVPPYHVITIEAWGGGGGAGGITNHGGTDGTNGGATSIVGGAVNITALGGSKGQRCSYGGANGIPGPGAVPGTSGNDYNLGGAAGRAVSFQAPASLGDGGTGANGGAGGGPGKPGTFPGGGGGAIMYNADFNVAGCFTGAGGGGGYARSVYQSTTQLAVGTVLRLTLGAGGAGSPSEIPNKPGAGASGKLKIVWN